MAAPGVLGNDNDPEGATLTAVLVANVPTTAGSVTLNADGSYVYDPTAVTAFQSGQTAERPPGWTAYALYEEAP